MGISPAERAGNTHWVRAGFVKWAEFLELGHELSGIGTEGILPVSSNAVISRDMTVLNLSLGQNLTIAGIY